jgi:tryptophanyl-tRNA synthetase
LTDLALADEAGITSRKGRTYVKDADSHIEMLRDMAKGGNVNAHHILQLCVAERASIDSSNTLDNVKLLYNKAIASSSRSGILHDAAISNERAGQFMLKRGDAERAQDYVQRSAELYLDWGAMAKVRYIQNKYAFILPEAPLHQLQSTSVLARKKFSSDVANKHKAVDISRYNLNSA